MAHPPTARQRLRLTLQHLLPHHLLTRVVRAAAHWQWRPWSRFLVRCFVRAYRPDMSEAAVPDPDRYPSFNAFFTRPLKDGARDFDHEPALICSPVDGIVSRTGIAETGRLIQAKGVHYELDELFGGAQMARRFQGGAYATLYLSPSHYHRVHMPVDGTLREARFMPGRLFSVAPFTVEGVPRLFCRNERLVCLFDTPAGCMAQVLVGAMLVAGIETVWHGPYGHRRRPAHWQFGPEQVSLDRGTEMGRFNMGSTVILLFERDRATWREALLPGDPVRLGERIGELLVSR